MNHHNEHEHTKNNETIESTETPDIQDPDMQQAQEADIQQDTCQQALSALKEKYARVRADFENYTRRIEKEKATWMRVGQEAVVLDILPIVDDFERAVKEHHKKERTAEMEAWLVGFEMIYKQVQKMLQKHEVIEITDHEVFDPTFHEALVQVDSPTHTSGEIVDILEKGYRFKGAVLRPAKVSVAK